MNPFVRQDPGGFTVIELLVVLVSLALLLSIAAPRYVQHIDHAREIALKQNLWQMRDAIDKFHADQGRYPSQLSELVTRGYLRAVPTDPVTDRADTWKTYGPDGQAAERVADVRSGSAGQARDGTSFSGW